MSVGPDILRAVDFADLTLTQWQRFDTHAAHKFALQVAEQVGGRVSAVQSTQHGGAPLHQAVIEHNCGLFALVPGGTTLVGYDVERWQPSARLLAAYREQTLARGFGFPADPRDLLNEYLAPRRTVTLPALLVAVDSEHLTVPADQTPQVLSERALRMPSPDEWEHACAAGATTLWRWAEQCPLDRSPYGHREGPHKQLNAFGLHIAHEVYDAELTSDPSVIKGGDGGEAVCGGYGSFVEWLPLATANRNPNMAEFIHGPDGEDMYEDFHIRPVIEI